LSIKNTALGVDGETYWCIMLVFVKTPRLAKRPGCIASARTDRKIAASILQLQPYRTDLLFFCRHPLRSRIVCGARAALSCECQPANRSGKFDCFR